MSQQIENLANKRENNKKNSVCFYCGISRHFKKDCKKFARDKRNGCVRKNEGRNIAYKRVQGTQTNVTTGSGQGNI